MKNRVAEHLFEIALALVCCVLGPVLFAVNQRLVVNEFVSVWTIAPICAAIAAALITVRWPMRRYLTSRRWHSEVVDGISSGLVWVPGLAAALMIIEGIL